MFACIGARIVVGRSLVVIVIVIIVDWQRRHGR
jgi:hypothetical protein